MRNPFIVRIGDVSKWSKLLARNQVMASMDLSKYIGIDHMASAIWRVMFVEDSQILENKRKSKDESEIHLL